MLQLDLAAQQVKTRFFNDHTEIYDPVRKLWVALTPEEHVRQLLISRLSEIYPQGKIAVEKVIPVGERLRRFDLVVYGKDHQPWLLAECKAPGVPVNEATLQQLLHYQSNMQCRYWLLCNGINSYCAEADETEIKWLQELPAYDL